MKTQKGVYVFGIGKYCKNKIEYLKNTFSIQGYLDNKIADGEEIRIRNDLTAYHPNKIRSMSKVSVLIMVSINYLKDVVLQLEEMGIDENDIYIGMNYEPPMTSIERYMRRHSIRIVIKNRKLYILFNNELMEVCDYASVLEVLREIDIKSNNISKIIAELPIEPYSRYFGSELGGKPIDRYYIEQFMEIYKDSIKGTVMEVAESLYTNKYGHEVKESIITHVYGEGSNAIKMNLATGEGVNDSMADCFICTQTLQMIYDLNAAIKNIYKLLKPNGVALITMHANGQISQSDNNLWGEYWRFTKKSVRMLVRNSGFSLKKTRIKSYGNVKIITAFLYGLCMEQISMQDYEYNDEQYPLIITIFARK